MSTTKLGLEPLIGVEELAEYLGFPVQTIYDWRLSGGRRGPTSSASICGSRPATSPSAWSSRGPHPLPRLGRTDASGPGDGAIEAGGRSRIEDEARPAQRPPTRRHDAHAGQPVPGAGRLLARRPRPGRPDRAGDPVNYERDINRLVLPAFRGFTLREIGVARCDALLKQLGNSSYSSAKRARTVLRQSFALAVRHEVLLRNPIDNVARLHKPRRTPTALTATEVNAIRAVIKA